MSQEEVELPPATMLQYDSVFDGDGGQLVAYYTADQMREYARQAVLAEREKILRIVAAQAEAIAEDLYGHPREKAIEWAKLDKFESEYAKAEDMLAIVAAAIRRG